MNKKIAAVTGARGMIGELIVFNLIKEGWNVRVLTRSSGYFKHKKIEEFVSDLHSEKLDEFVKGVDAVFHCAAELYNEKKMHSTNVNGTKKLLKAVSNSNISYFCHLSSAGVIGPTSLRLVDESTPCNPRNAYEISKYKAELLIRKSKLDANTCILRPTNVITLSKPGVISLAVRGNWIDKVKVFIKGGEGAHIVHAVDVARAALYFMGKGTSKIDTYFVSQDGDNNNSISFIYNLYQEQCGCNSRVAFSLPVVLPYIIRYFFRGKSLHGDVRFSNNKIIDAGFSFDYDVNKCVSEICSVKGGKF